MIVTSKCFTYDESNYIWKKMFECSQTSKTSLTQNAKDFSWIWLSNKAILIRKINNSHQKRDWWMFKFFFIHYDDLFDFFIKRLLIINCTLSFNDNKHKLKTLINIDAIDYAFIDKEIAQLVCNMLNIKLVFLLKSKFLIEFDDRQFSSIIHVIYFKLTIDLHFELIAFLLIIDLNNHSIILNKSWMNKHKIILNMIYDKLIFESFKYNNIFNNSIQIWRLRTFELNRR